MNNTPKTPEIRAAELFKSVNGPGDAGSQFAFDLMNPSLKNGWIKLGKFVLSLERKWTEAKKKGQP